MYEGLFQEIREVSLSCFFNVDFISSPIICLIHTLF
jgi:hypothetical protein